MTTAQSHNSVASLNFVLDNSPKQVILRATSWSSFEICISWPKQAMWDLILGAFLRAPSPGTGSFQPQLSESFVLCRTWGGGSGRRVPNEFGRLVFMRWRCWCFFYQNRLESFSLKSSHKPRGCVCVCVRTTCAGMVCENPASSL